jgi:hypothetical protein
MDSLGFLWFGTSSGLAKFDGDTTWQVWHDLNSPLLSNNITSIIVGPDNTKYFATINGGMCDFNDTTFSIYTVAGSGISDNSAFCVAIDPFQTRYYASPAAGVMLHYDFNSWGYYNTIGSGIGSNALTWVTVDSQQTIYAASMDRGVSRFVPPVTWTVWDTLSSPIPDGYAQCVVKENNHIVWIATREGGLVRIDENPTGIGEHTGNTRETPECYPNPVNAGRMISFSVVVADETPLELLDVNGRIVFRSLVHENTVQLPPELCAGVYVLRLHPGDAAPASLKLIVR